MHVLSRKQLFYVLIKIQSGKKTYEPIELLSLTPDQVIFYDSPNCINILKDNQCDDFEVVPWNYLCQKRICIGHSLIEGMTILWVKNSDFNKNSYETIREFDRRMFFETHRIMTIVEASENTIIAKDNKTGAKITFNLRSYPNISIV